MIPAIGHIRIYTFVYVLSMLSHVYFAQRWCHKLALPRRAGLWLSAFYFFGMAVGARILYDLVQHRFDPRNYLRLAYYFSDGMWGGPLAYLMLASMFILVRSRRKGVMFDLMVLSLPWPMVLAKVACLLNGCCYGLPCNWAWCVAFPEGAKAPAGIARHPTQAYEIAVLLVIWVVLITLDRRRWSGLLTLWFVVLYGLGRPLTEVFRVSDENRPSMGSLATSQAVCLAAALAAIMALWFLHPRRRTYE